MERRDHVEDLRGVLDDLEELRSILGKYDEHRWRVGSVLDRLARAGSPERAAAGHALAQRLVTEGHLGSRARYSVFFPPHRSDLGRLDPHDWMSLLQAVGVFRSLTNQPDARCEIIGHCRASEDESIALGRAMAVRDYFVSEGVPATYLAVRAHDPGDCCHIVETTPGIANEFVELCMSSAPRGFEVARARESVVSAIASYADLRGKSRSAS